MLGDVDLRIADLAMRQHGVFAWWQARDLGATPAMRRSRLAANRWASMQPSVFRLVGTPSTFDQALMATFLAGGEGAALSHRSGAVVWGVPKVARRLEIIVPPHRDPRPRGVVVHRTHVDPQDVVDHAGMRVTTPAMTIFHLASVLQGSTLRAVVEHAFATRLVSRERLLETLDRYRMHGRRGVRAMEAVLDLLPTGAVPESDLEQLLVDVLSRLEGPPPVLQHEVRLPDGRIKRIDAAYPGEMLAIEANSYRHHSSFSAWASDNVRTGELTALGWRVLPVTKLQLVESPDDWLDLVRSARARAT